jgi:hypothetical protein
VAAGGLYAAACYIGYNAVQKNKVRNSKLFMSTIEAFVNCLTPFYISLFSRCRLILRRRSWL